MELFEAATGPMGIYHQQREQREVEHHQGAESVGRGSRSSLHADTIYANPYCTWDAKVLRGVWRAQA
jgi:hypothetical protein